MFFLSSAEGARWAEIATEMTERVRSWAQSFEATGERFEQPMEDKE